jgi:hypothetical protein
VLGLGDAAAGGEGYWAWAAPPTTSIVNGSVELAYDTSSANTSVYLKARLRSESFAASPAVRTAQGASRVSWPIPAGNELVAVGMRTAVAHTYASKWNNHLRILSLTATLRDDTAPTASIGGPLADGAWHNEIRPVPLTVDAADAGAGVRALELADAAGATLDSASAPATSASQPGAESVSRELATAPASLGDGHHTLTVTVRDAAGEARTLPVDVLVDAHAPALGATFPEGTTTLRRPAVSFAVDPGPSGLAQLEASLDGRPMTVAGTTASLQPDADLAYGSHTVTWHAVDGAGNARDGFWTFDVVDPAPPELSQAAPADGWSGELRQPSIGFLVTDAGTGIDPTTLTVALDGVDVTAAGTFADGRFDLVPARLALGEHRVRVTVSDRSGNAMPAAEWSFSVVDATPPVLVDVRPDAGSSGSDRTPPIAFSASDGDGSGIDPASLVLTLDGDDVAAQTVASGGRFTYTPAAPLGFGTHTVSARLADLAGNVSAPQVWTFTVRDEAPPVVAGRTPVDGTTVAGAATIGFDVSDVGTGVDLASLQVLVDGADVGTWGSLQGGRFTYNPGNLGPGAHTVSVTVADRAGNVTGPAVWTFAVANPVTLGLAFRSGPAAVVYGGRTTLSFVARATGAPLPGARVLVSTRPAGHAQFGPARTLTAGAAGIVSWPIAPAHTTAYRVALADTPTVTATHTVAVRQRVTLAAGRPAVRRGMPVRLSGRVAPGRPHARVALQLLTARGWATVARPVLTAASGFAKVVIPPVRGRYLFRVVIAGTPANAAGTSRTVAVLVR